MAVDLAGMAGGVPERFVPETMQGQLIEAEHLGRYAWAAPLARGRRALDAGCGLAYGAAMLAQAGAEEVVGVDLAEPILEAARGRLGDAVKLEQADVRALPFGDGEFGLVTCFEVIEHVEDPLTVLDELRRVLAPDGLLVISSPNRRRSPGNNPHHVHEFEPEELERELSSRWAQVRMLRQSDAVGALIYDPAQLSDGPLSVDARATGDFGGDELYTVALCGNGPLPPTPPSVVLTGLFALEDWLRLIDEQDRALVAQAAHQRRLQARLDEQAVLADRLIDAEQLLNEVSELRAQERHLLSEGDRLRDELTGLRDELTGLRDELTGLRDELTGLRERAQRAEANVAAVRESRSWRVTAPLRRVMGG